MLLGGAGPEPGPDRPLLPRHEALVAQQANPRMVRGISPGRGLERVTPVHGDLLPLDARDDARELLAGLFAGHRLPGPVQLAVGHPVTPPPPPPPVLRH